MAVDRRGLGLEDANHAARRPGFTAAILPGADDGMPERSSARRRARVPLQRTGRIRKNQIKSRGVETGTQGNRVMYPQCWQNVLYLTLGSPAELATQVCAAATGSDELPDEWRSLNNKSSHPPTDTELVVLDSSGLRCEVKADVAWRAS